jgi:hypothetical protein
LTNDYAPADLHITRVQSLIDELNRQIDDRVAGIMASLENQLQSEKAALDALTASVETAKEKDQAEAVKGQPYWKKSAKLGDMIEFHKLLAAKIERKSSTLKFPKPQSWKLPARPSPETAPSNQTRP